MEKPFCMGESIAGESISEIPLPNFLPRLDVKNEIELALTCKKAFGNNAVTQKMKELGLERYWVFLQFLFFFVFCLFVFFFFFSFVHFQRTKRNSRLYCK